MSIVDRCDEVLRIKEKIASIADVLWGNWIHMMDNDSAKYLPALDAEVTTFVSGDNQISNAAPFGRAIEKLIHVAVKTKSLFADLTI